MYHTSYWARTTTTTISVGISIDRASSRCSSSSVRVGVGCIFQTKWVMSMLMLIKTTTTSSSSSYNTRSSSTTTTSTLTTLYPDPIHNPIQPLSITVWVIFRVKTSHRSHMSLKISPGSPKRPWNWGFRDICPGGWCINSTSGSTSTLGSGTGSHISPVIPIFPYLH